MGGGGGEGGVGGGREGGGVGREDEVGYSHESWSLSMGRASLCYSTVVDMEKERAQLLIRATSSEEQVCIGIFV